MLSAELRLERITSNAGVKLLAIALLGAALEHLLAPEQALFISLLAAGCTFLPRYAPSILAIGSLWHTFFFPNALMLARIRHVPDITRWWLDTQSAWSPDSVSGKAQFLIKCAAVVVAFVAARAIIKTRNRWLRENPAIAAFLLSALLLALFLLSAPIAPIPAVFFLAAFVIWSKALWCALILRRSWASSGDFSVGSIWLMNPAWATELVPSWPVWSFRDATDPGNLARNADRLRPALIVSSVAFLSFTWLNGILSGWLYGKLGLPNFYGDGITVFLRTVPNVAMAWALFLWTILSILIFFFGFTIHLVIMMQWAFGIPAPASVQFPHRARSFHEFMYRIMFYYSQTLQIVALFPVVSMLSRFRILRRYPKFRIFLATFLAVLGVGLGYHFFKDLHVILSQGLGPGLRLWSNLAVYVALLAFVIALSAALTRKRSREPDAPPEKLFARAIRLSLILCAYGFVSFVGLTYSVESWESRAAFFKFLVLGIR